MNLRKIFMAAIAAALCLTVLSCAKQKDENSAELQDQIPEKEYSVTEELDPIDFKDLYGRWMLKYSGNFGYDFRFSRNYKSVMVLYLGASALVFNGVYTIENGNLKVNIYEMKHEDRVDRVDIYGNFIKTKSSSFLFRAGISKKNTKDRALVLRPLSIIIDGNTSDGYFEPVMKLKSVQ